MKQTTLIALALVGYTSAAPKGDRKGRFMDWASNYNRAYTSVQEFENRMEIWEGLDDIVSANNARAAQIDAANGNSNAMKLKLNKFADMSEQEVRKWTGSLPEINMPIAEESREDFISAGDKGRKLQTTLPLRIDHALRANGLGNMNAVKDQLGCGACWAFTATAQLEGAINANFGTGQAPISNQMLLDCT